MESRVLAGHSAVPQSAAGHAHARDYRHNASPLKTAATRQGGFYGLLRLIDGVTLRLLQAHTPSRALAGGSSRPHVDFAHLTRSRYRLSAVQQTVLIPHLCSSHMCSSSSPQPPHSCASKQSHQQATVEVLQLQSPVLSMPPFASSETASQHERHQREVLQCLPTIPHLCCYPQYLLDAGAIDTLRIEAIHRIRCICWQVCVDGLLGERVFSVH